MKKENHQWVKNIEYYLWKIGYRNVCENLVGWKKPSFKLSFGGNFHNFMAKTSSSHVKTTSNHFVPPLQTELMAEIYSKSPVRAIGKALLMKFY